MTDQYHYSHLSVAEKILTDYDGSKPFHQFLREYFRNNKKHGSRDRRNISNLTYNYFRAGKSMRQLPVKQRLDALTDMQALKGSDIFPFEKELSEGIDAEQFGKSFLIQPKVFVRIRPGFDHVVTEKLKRSAITFEELPAHSIAFESNTQIDKLLQPDKEIVIQDHNSQRTGELMQEVTKVEQPSVWDCCAGSGGKSILAYDLIPGLKLTVTDKRESILQNLRKRFEVAGIKNYTSAVIDLAEKPFDETAEKFDLIIVDAPCTGSGTWARTPEQLYYFNLSSIDRYAAMQKKIISNAIKLLKPGGHLLYITCSVFRKENEDIAGFISDLGIQLKQKKLYAGYSMRADTLFAALFINQ